MYWVWNAKPPYLLTRSLNPPKYAKPADNIRTAPWTGLLLYSRERRFLKLPVDPARSPAIRGILPPPAAASAAGGWGIPGSRLVHSLGFGRVPAGGAVEVVVLLLPEFASSPFPFCGGDLRSSVVRVSTSPRSWLLGRLKVLPGRVAGRRIWRMKKICRFPAAFSVDHGDGSVDPRLGDFPSAQKLAPSSKACEGAVAAARHRPVLVVVVFAGIQEGPVCNISCISGSFCMNGESI